MCFLEREVYAFLSTFDKRGERVRGAMLRARIFCLWGRGKQRGRRAAERARWAARRRWWARRHTRGRAATRERREEGCFLFSLGGDFSFSFLFLGRSEERLSFSSGCRDTAADRGPATQLVAGGYLGGLRPPKFQLIQLICLRYLCGDAERREWRCPCFPSLCIYSIS